MAQKFQGSLVSISALKRNFKELSMKLLTKNISLKTFAVTGLVAAISLASGCSNDDPDQGETLESSALFGRVVDGYLAGATVYLDINNNGVRNAGEPKAITDKDGFFSTGKDGTNYCADDATTAQARHCLAATQVGTEVVLRSYGGFDILTGEPFDGSLSTRVSVVDGVIENQMITPITSLLAGIESADDRQSILDAYGLSDTDLERDFLDDSGFDANTVGVAIASHKVVSLLAEVFDERYDAFGSESGFPDNVNSMIYRVLANQIVTSGDLAGLSSGDLVTALTAVVNAVQTEIRALYDANSDLSFPGNVNGSAAIANAADIVALVDSALPLSTASASEAQDRVIGVEMVVQKMLNGDSNAEVDAAISYAEDTGSSLYTAISGAEVLDFSTLAGTDFTDESPNLNDIDITGAIALNALANKQLSVVYDEDEDLSDNKSGAAYFFFNGDEGSATSGTFNICLKYDDGESEVNADETSGALLDGTWFALDAYRLVLNIEGSIDIALISQGVVTVDGEEKSKFGLSYGGDTVTWLSDTGLLDELQDSGIQTQATSDAGCVSILGS
jgi:hypothetical protein